MLYNQLSPDQAPDTLDGPDIRFDSDIIQAGKMIAGDSLEGARMGNMAKIGNPVWASQAEKLKSDNCVSGHVLSLGRKKRTCYL